MQACAVEEEQCEDQTFTAQSRTGTMNPRAGNRQAMTAVTTIAVTNPSMGRWRLVLMAATLWQGDE